MKIYTGYPGITKITNDKGFYQTEDLANVISVYVNQADVTGITYTLALEFLRADGRKTTIYKEDSFASGEATTLTEDNVTYDIHNFTLTNTQLAVAGALAFTCYINILNSGVVEKRGVLFNAVSNVRKTVTYSANTIFVVSKDDEDVPTIVADMKTAIETLAGQLASKVNKADVTDNLTTNDSNKVLSAKQGKVLKTMLEGLAEIDGGNVDTFKANDFILDGISLKDSLFDYIDNVDITDTLTLTSRYLDKANGNANPDSNSRCTDYIDLSTYTGFWISGHSQYATTLICTYDANKTFLRSYGDGTSAGQTFTDYEYIPQSDEKYVRFSTYQYTQYPLKVISLGVFTPINKEKQDNYLFNKKYVACGDSFTKGDVIAGTKVYPYLIAQRNNMRLVNMAHNGSYCHYGENGFTNPNNSYYYQNIPLDADIITIAYGLNETSTTIGTKDSADNTTIWGAYNEVLGWITTNIPNAKVGIISNDAWMTYDLRNALQEIASYWGVEFLDLKEYGKPFMISGKYSQDGDVKSSVVTQRTNQYCVSSTNGHPNELGHKVRSYIVENFLRGAYGVDNSYTRKETDTKLDLKADKSNTYTKTEVDTLLATKQNTLTFDSTPTENSTNPVTSGGVYNAINGAKSYTDKAINYLRWELGSHTLDVVSDTDTSFSKSVPSGAIGCQINQVGGKSYKSENLLNIADVAETTTNGITYKVENGVITLNGTATQRVEIRLMSYAFKVGTYSVKAFDIQNLGSVNVRFFADAIMSNSNLTSTTLSNTFSVLTAVKSDFGFVVPNGANVNATFKYMLVSGSTAPTTFKPYFSGIRDSAVTSVVSKGSNNTTIGTLTIPSAIQNLTGYGQSNPDDQTQYNYIDFVDKIFVRVGYIDNDTWVASALNTDISAYLTTDTIDVEGGGSLEFTNTYSQDVPSDIDYLIEEVKA